MKLPEVAVRRPVTTVMVFAALAMLGGVAASRLNLDMLPDIEPPAISVITPYPGATASDVESDVTKYLEDQLTTTPNLDRLESKSLDNLSVITCRFAWGTNLDVAVNDVREKMDLAKPDIDEHAPDAKEPFIFKFSSAMSPILVLTVTATESTPDLYRIVDKQISDALKRVPGVGAILLYGSTRRQINVHFDRQALEAYHLSVQQVRTLLAAQNLDLPAGTAKVGRQALQIRVTGRYQSPEQIAATVVGTSGDGLVRLRDVAEVADAHEEPTIWGWSGGVPGMVMVIQKQSGTNTVNVINAVKDRLRTIQPRLPADLRIDIVMDSSEDIYAMLHNVGEAAYVGGILVVVICFLFLRRFRTSLIVVLAIPFSIIVAFLGMFMAGYTLNVVSLMSLAIAVGMVVDDSIVVLENITRHVEEGKPPRQAAVQAASEVGLAVTASSLTIVAVFAPLLFLAGTGITGIMFNQLAFMILLTIMVSLFTSLTLIPMASSRLLHVRRPEEKANWFFRLGERSLTALDNAYARLLEWALSHRLVALSLILMVFAGSLFLVRLVGTEFMPPVDTGDLDIVMQLPEGTRGEVTAATTRRALDILVEKVPELDKSYAFAGQSETGFGVAMGMEEGLNIGEIGGRLVDKQFRRRTARQIAAELRPVFQAFPEVEKLSVMGGSMTQQIMLGSEKPVSIEVLGNDLDTLNRVAGQIRDIVAATPGAVDVTLSSKKLRPEIHVRLDRDKAATLGLNVASVADALRTNYYGFSDTKFRDAGDDFDIELRLKKNLRESLQEIGETPLATPAGQMVKLRNVAYVEQAYGPVQIDRKNRARVIRVLADIEQGYVLSDVVGAIRARMGSLELPPGIEIEWGGYVREQETAFGALGLLLILAVVLVYMVMAGQFEDFVDPFIIMFSVPFAFVGVAFAMVLTATPLNLFSYIGIIMLVGIVVKNAIVLVDYVKQLRQRGLGLREAIVRGGRTRLRPVVMTSLTTIFGMVPMALSRGEGSELWNALGITVIGGMILSSLVTLVLIPLLYSLIHGRRAQPAS